MIKIQLELLLLVAAGYFVTKKGVLTAAGRGELTNLVIYVILPCNIFASFQKGITRETLADCALVLLIGFCMQGLYILLNRVLYRRVPARRRVVMQYATICNNSGFMGMAVLGGVLGEPGLLYGAINLIPIRVFMWTAGLGLFTATDFKTKLRTLATHPCILAVPLGFAYALAPFTLPAFLTDTVRLVGGCTTALSMLIVGSILAGTRLRDALDRDCFAYSLLRLILIPALVLGVLSLLGTDRVVTSVAVLSSAMPAATTTAMLADKYGADAAFAAKLIFVSTALSLVTLPLAALALGI
ncbi:MAG: AEC family transporter [Oscillospiraceae bacterium]|jgi:predicted permease|nr:AEC family transporter [Oscillospiraceae bacterium]